jgi:arylsulfatase A-like enzyme
MLALVNGCEGRTRTPNILVVVADTLRADRIGAYGNTRGLTPFLDSLAARGFVFHNAIATSCWTNPSIASLFTSRYPWQHGTVSLTGVLAQSEATLTELLRAQGYLTAGWSANPLLWIKGGWDQGFDHYEAPVPSKVEGVAMLVPERGPALNDKVRTWLGTHSAQGSDRERPRYLYVQYMEPHTPYAPPADVIDQLFRDAPKPDLDLINGGTMIAGWIGKGHPLQPEIEQVYDAQVLAFDKSLSGLFDALSPTGFLDNAIVIITADHGEGLWDHGVYGHGGSLYDELIRVPLIVTVPREMTRVDIEETVSLVDVAPTLLDFAGATPPSSFMGQSLRDYMEPPWSIRGLVQRARSASSPPRIAYSDMGLTRETAEKSPSRHRRAVIVGPYKLIAGPDGHAEFYDRARDPTEQGGAAVVESMQQTLRQSYALGAPPPEELVVGETAELDSAQMESFRALGYAE